MSSITKPLASPPDNFSTQIASSTVASNALSIELDSTTGLPTEGVGQLFKKDSDGNIVSGSIEFIHWTNVSGNSITLTDTGDRGITGSDSGAQSYVADDYFEVWVSSYYHNTSSEVVTLSGAQTVAGVKTFSDEPTFSAGVNLADGQNIQNNNTNPRRAIYIPASGMTTATTSGAASGTLETSTNKVVIPTFDFDASSDEYVTFGIPSPLYWDASTVTAQFFWSAASSSGDVVWGAQGVSLANDDALDTAYGTAQTVTDTLTATGDMCITSATSAITIAGTPTAGDYINFRIYRDANAGADTLAADAQLIGVRISFGIDKYSDE